jgi:hypothetical protein
MKVKHRGDKGELITLVMRVVILPRFLIDGMR